MSEPTLPPPPSPLLAELRTLLDDYRSECRRVVIRQERDQPDLRITEAEQREKKARAALDAKLVELCRDAERMDWLSQDGNAASTHYETAEASALLGTIRCVSSTLREAIDDARAYEDRIASRSAAPSDEGGE